MESEQRNRPLPGARKWARELWRRPRARVGVLVVVTVAAALVAWLVTSAVRSDTNAAPSFEPVGPIALTAPDLRTLSTSVGQPIYWAGPMEGYLYELTRTSEGNVLVRYLPPGVKAGAEGSDYLVIATYPYVDALQALRNVEGQKFDLPEGGLALVDTRTPKSVHLAYPGVDYQVEVFDPSPVRALAVARSGDVRRVG